MKEPAHHPDELDLAAFAGGDVNFFRRVFLERHLRACESCADRFAGFRELRSALAELPPPDVDWESLATEMRANIHLGLEAGECVRETPGFRLLSPRLGIVFASLVVLAGAAFFVRDYLPSRAGSRSPVAAASQPAVLETNTDGIRMRTGPNSFAFLNREGRAASQTVSADGAVRSRDIDGDTGSVTIRDVYLQ